MVFIIFTASFVLILYHHLGYPLLLNIFANRKPRIKPGKSSPLNKFIFVIPMHNEEKYINKKIANFAEISYPAQLFEVWLLNDGSTDETLALAKTAVKKYPDLTVKIKSSPVNQGKVFWFNRVIPDIPDDYIVFFSDVSATLSSDVLQKANLYFNNPRVGAYCTRYKLQKQDLAGEKHYWHYQSEIKIQESKLGTPIGYHGTGYAIRKSLWKKLPFNTINDDFVLPLQAIEQIIPVSDTGKVFRQRYQGVYDPRCVSVEQEQSSLSSVFHRRTRLAAGNIQQVFILYKLLDPRQGWVAWMFFSGKVLRIFIPWLMISLFVSTLVLSMNGSILFGVFLLGQIIFYLSTLTNLLFQSSITGLITYFIKGQTAMLSGWFYFFKLNKTGLWNRANKMTRRPYIHPIVRVGKWLTDKFFALIGLLILICITPFFAILIKLSSSGPVFYKQLRVGLGTNIKTKFFYVYKFRTMRINSELGGSLWTEKNDPRVFKFGSFLRRTHLDELPQVINIFKGDMSLIGPRPERVDLYPYIVKNIPFYQERLFEVLPGLTGLSQVTYGYDRTIKNVRRRVALDFTYAINLTKPWIWFKTDIKIFFITIKMILLRQDP